MFALHGAWSLLATLALVSADSRTDLHGDPLPTGALARLGTVRLRHEVESIALSPDGKVLATAGSSSDSHVILWDTATGKEFRRLPPWGRQAVISFSRDGRILVRSGHGQTQLFDPATGKLLREFQGHFWNLTPDGKFLAAGGAHMTPKEHITIWTVASGKEVCKLEHAGTTLAVVFSPDGKTVATTYRPWGEQGDRTLQLWDAQTGKRLHQLPGQSPRGGGHCDLAFSPDSKVVALADGNQPLRLHDVATGKEVAGPQQEKEQRTFPRYVLFTPDGKHLVTESHPNGIGVWERATGKWVRHFEGVFPLLVGDGSLILTQAESGLRLHKFATGEVLHLFKGERESLYHFTVSRDGKVLAAAERSRIRVWDTTTGKERATPEGPGFRLSAVAYSPDGKLVAAAAQWEGTIRLWDSATGKLVRKFETPSNSVTHLAISPDGTRLASAEGRELRLWDVASGKELHRLEGHRGEVTCLAFASDGKTLASGSANPHAGARIHIPAGSTQVIVWSTTTGKPVGRHEREGPGFAHVVHSGSRWLAFEGGIELLRVLDVESGRILREFPGQFAALSPDGRILAVGGRKPDVQFVEMASGKELIALPREAGFDLAYAFSSDGRFLAAGKNNGEVHVWSVATGKLCRKLAAHPEAVMRLAFSVDGRTLTTASADTTALVWDWPTMERAERLPARKLAPEEGELLWADLAGDDGKRTHAAIWVLIAANGQGVALLKAKLKPSTAEDVKAIRQLIADLDDSRFAVRERASKELAALGDEAEAALLHTLEGKPSAEVRRRIQALLAAPSFIRSPEVLRRLRALQVLEQIGTKEARALLDALADGSPLARQTREARLALERLNRRAMKP